MSYYYFSMMDCFLHVNDDKYLLNGWKTSKKNLSAISFFMFCLSSIMSETIISSIQFLSIRNWDQTTIYVGGKHWTNEIPLVFLDDQNDWKSMNVIIIKLFKKMNWNIILFCCDFLQCLLPVLSGCFECKKNTSIWLKQTIKRRERKKKPKKRETIEKKRK